MRSTRIRMSIGNVTSASQEQRLYQELSKPHHIPGNPTRNVTNLMDEFPS